MKALRNKALSFITALLLVFTLLPLLPEGVMSAGAEESKYELWVATTQVTSSNKSDILGGGEASFDPKTSTLTLKNDITVVGEKSVLDNNIDGLTINTAKDVTLTSDSKACMVLRKSATITGTGKLSAISLNSIAISVNSNNGSVKNMDNLKIENADLQVYGSNGIYGAENSTLNIIKSNVYSCRAISSGNPIGNFKEINLSDCKIDNPSGGKVSNNSSGLVSITDEYGQVPIQVKIEAVVVCEHELILTPSKPHCTEDGNKRYYTCKKCGKYFSDKEGKNEIEKDSWIVPKTGHYMVTIYATEPTCTEDGNIKCYLCFNCFKYFKDKDGKNEIAKEKAVIPKGHLWGTPNWTWTGTKAANASFVCQRDKSHTQSIDATITTKTTDPTCTKAGKTVYTATVKLNGKAYTDTKTVTLKATGHKWGTPTYKWSKDNKTVTATRVCQNDKNHKQIETVNVTAKTTNATCTKAGKSVYTSAAFKNTAFKVQTKTVTLKATGHKFSAWKTTSFNVDKKTATQTRKCTHGDKTETKTVKNAVVHFAGSDRAQTASLISSGMYKTADTVIIATGFDFHDALAAVPLASAYNAPLLLADRDNLSDKTINEIKRLKAKNVIVVATTTAKDNNGYDAAIRNNVYKQLKELKVKVTKLDGANYYATAKKVADQLKTKSKKAPTSVFVTTDKNYADALSASPVAAILNAPIIYVKPTGALDSNTKNYLASIKKSVKDVYIVGGVNAVSKSVEKSVLSVLGKKSATRFAGDNRYDTCVLVNKSFAKNLTGKSVCIAKGYNFPDALAGGVFAAQQKAPLFLADIIGGKAELSKTQSSYLKSKNPGKLYIFGGETAVPTALVKTVAKACV